MKKYCCDEVNIKGLFSDASTHVEVTMSGNVMPLMAPTRGHSMYTGTMFGSL